MLGWLHVQGRHVLLSAARHTPRRSPAPQGVAYRWNHAPSEVVFEVTVGKPDYERPGGQRTPPYSLKRRVPGSFDLQTLRIPVHVSGDEPNTQPPVVLGQQNTTKLGETLGRLIKGAEDCLPVLDRESDEILLSLERDDERPCRVIEPRVVEQPSELEHILVSHSMPASSIAARLPRELAGYLSGCAKREPTAGALWREAVTIGSGALGAPSVLASSSVASSLARARGNSAANLCAGVCVRSGGVAHGAIVYLATSPEDQSQIRTVAIARREILSFLVIQDVRPVPLECFARFPLGCTEILVAPVPPLEQIDEVAPHITMLPLAIGDVHHPSGSFNAAIMSKDFH